MGRQFKESFPLRDGGRVGYSLKKPKGRKFYVVQFYDPKEEYQRISTGERVESEARIEAARIIARHFYPDEQRSKSLTWDDLIERLERALTVNNNRAATFRDYRKTIRVIRETLPQTKGPLDVTPALAQQFKSDYFTGTFKRGKGEDAKEYERTHATLEAAIRKASSIWNKWLSKTFHLTAVNPWSGVEVPRKDKRAPKAPPEEVVLEFMKWLWEKKYPGWKLPLAFVMLKCALGCRLGDICSLRADQLRKEGIFFEADQTKNREEHVVILPEDLAAQLVEVKGEEYLWDRYPDQLRQHLISRKLQHGQINPLFDVKTFYGFIGQLFKDFTKETGKKLRSHDLRKRAVTAAIKAGMTRDMAASQFGMTPQNVSNYLDRTRLGTDPSLTARLTPKFEMAPATTTPTVQQPEGGV